MVIGERYSIIRPLGQGGMSRVLLAEDLRLHMKCAVKVIDCRENYLSEAMIAEANVLRSVRQENLVRITDIFKWEDKVCLVMEYVEGYRLSDLLKKKPELIKRHAADFSVQLMHALTALHERQKPIIYRDMKPDNIMVRPDLTVCLIDFGTAKQYRRGSKDDLSLGTRNFAAPEQFDGMTDVRSDIYSLGKTMERMAGPDPDRAIKDVVKRATDQDRQKRYPTVREMEKDFKRKRNRLLYRLGFLSAVACITLVVLSVSWGLKQRKAEALTADLYRRTVESGNEAVYNSDYSLGEQYYTKAILEINGNEEEGYRKLLSLYRKEKKPEEGLERMDSYIDSGYGNTDRMDRLLYECGLCAFEDLKDYKKAGKYFGLADPEKIPEITYLSDISEYLTSFEKDPEGIMSCIREFRSQIENTAEKDKQAEDRLICAEVCLTLSEEMKEGKEEASAALLNEGYRQGRSYMEWMDENRMENDRKSLNMMSAICRLLGEKFPDKKEEYFSEAIAYLDLLDVLEPEDEAGRQLSIAKLYRDMGDKRNACAAFEKAEKENDPANAYTEHMKYLESLNSYGELMKVYERSLSVNGIQETKEYRKLIKSMERKGLLKG